jgi:hypothetical protein
MRGKRDAANGIDQVERRESIREKIKSDAAAGATIEIATRRYFSPSTPSHDWSTLNARSPDLPPSVMRRERSGLTGRDHPEPVSSRANRPEALRRRGSVLAAK